MIADQPRTQLLLIEDEAPLAPGLLKLLETEGYTIVGQARSGPAALALLQQQHIDLVLCDIRLQGPWDGIETARRLLAERPVPLIYLTALTDRASLVRALPTAPAAYLAKPVCLAGLRAAIEVALAGGVRAPQPALAGAAERGGEANQRELILRLDQHIFLKHNFRYVRLALADIVLLEADNTVTNLVTTNAHYTVRLSLTAVLERLSYLPLVRVHRSFALNLEHVSAFSDTEATLHDQAVPLGRQYKAAFLQHFQYH